MRKARARPHRETQARLQIEEGDGAVLEFPADDAFGGKAEPVAVEGERAFEVVDAAVGRQLWHARETVDRIRAKAGLHRVVLCLGTNGAFPPGDLDELLTSLQDARRVVLVNVRVPRSWESEVNMALAGAVARYPNTVLVDWHEYSKDRTDLFARDGIHVNRRGAEAYALLIAAGLAA